MEFEEIISAVNKELNEVYDIINSVTIVIVPEEKLEDVIDDVCNLKKKLNELIENEKKY